ncbi:MAG: hypothetical protein C0498_13870 [Anaerolinea sp.]|nr:hypothetical protein [Anaerolinea sp.]
MNRPRLALAGGLALALGLTACSSPAADRGVAETTATPAAPAPAATAVPAAPSPQVRVWGGFAVSFPYGSFAEWVRDAARGTGGVALVRIVAVSPVQWSTATGEGPGPADVARASQGEAEFAIGRLVTVELVRMLRGTWPAAGDTALYWLPGGRIGNDRTPEVYDLPEPRVGSVAVASTWSGADLDPTDGVVWLSVDRLFPADSSGRVRTFKPDETIMIGEIDRYLPAP